MARTQRVMHNHGYQAVSAEEVVLYTSEECPACRLIRPEVMTKIGLRMVSQGVHMGEVPQP